MLKDFEKEQTGAYVFFADSNFFEQSKRDIRYSPIIVSRAISWCGLARDECIAAGGLSMTEQLVPRSTVDDGAST